MNWRNVATIYRKELQDSLRDRRTLISMLLIPTFIMPLLMFGVGKVATQLIAKAREEIPVVMVLGGADSPGIVKQLQTWNKVRVVPDRDNWRDLISEKKIRAAVRLPTGFEAGLRAGRTDEVVVFHYEGELKSSFAAGELEQFFRELRDRAAVDLLNTRGLPASLIKPFEIARQNVAPPEKVGGNLFGGIVPYLIIILCCTGAMYPAMDLTAGEKERGTMETLLCSPVPREEIVLGKFLMVLTGSLGAMALSLLSLALTAAALGVLGTGNAAAGATAAQAGAGTIPVIDPLGLLGVIGMILPFAMLFSAVIMTVALFAKSYKEAQSYVGPFLLAVIMPAVLGMLPGIDLNARLALVPVLNLSLVCKEMLSGVWHWHYIALIFVSSCAYAAAALWISVRMFRREDVIFRV